MSLRMQGSKCCQVPTALAAHGVCRPIETQGIGVKGQRCISNSVCLCRYGPREDYRKYVATTPVLLPFMKPFYINNEAKPFESEAANLAPKPSS